MYLVGYEGMNEPDSRYVACCLTSRAAILKAKTESGFMMIDSLTEQRQSSTLISNESGLC